MHSPGPTCSRPSGNCRTITSSTLYLPIDSIGKTDAVGDVVVRADPAGVVRRARRRHCARRRHAAMDPRVEDGQPAVLFNVYEQPDGNAVQIAQAVQAKLAVFRAAGRRASA